MLSWNALTDMKFQDIHSYGTNASRRIDHTLEYNPFIVMGVTDAKSMGEVSLKTPTTTCNSAANALDGFLKRKMSSSRRCIKWWKRRKKHGEKETFRKGGKKMMVWTNNIYFLSYIPPVRRRSHSISFSIFSDHPT